MSTLARRWPTLTEEMLQLGRQIGRLVRQTGLQMVAHCGIGTRCATDLPITAGNNPGRLTYDPSFAHLTGTAPLDASSGQQQRHRRNRDSG